MGTGGFFDKLLTKNPPPQNNWFRKKHFYHKKNSAGGGVFGVIFPKTRPVPMISCDSVLLVYPDYSLLLHKL